MPARYTIGIDLGTTNCALAYVDTWTPRPEVKILGMVQLAAPGREAEEQLLPSFVYLPGSAEEEAAALSPFPEDEDRSPAVGIFAQRQASFLPGRVIHSAKSWLCYGAVDREAPILPWGSDEVETAQKLSPVAASAALLSHIKRVWEHRVGRLQENAAFLDQQVVVTVPSSFDEAAQRLTLQAAKLAGYPGIALLEEPQAAFVHWLETNSGMGGLPAALEGQEEALILICDIGGGTSDFSLFEVRPGGQTERGVRRIEVSDHILLGGDNIDLALAHRLEPLLTQGQVRLNVKQWNQLVFESRRVKERALSDHPGGELPVAIPGAGSKLFAQTLKASIPVQEVKDFVLEGFFPVCDAGSLPRGTSEGLREWGLPYAADTAVTRHLAGFLRGRTPDAVLFTGGTLKPRFLQERLHTLLNEWQGGKTLQLLSNQEMELGVAAGAALYAWRARSPQARIRGGYPHALYLELGGGRDSLLCLLPRGFEYDGSLQIEQHKLLLLLDHPARLQLYYASHRAADRPGDIIPFNESDFRPLPPLQTVLESGKKPQKGSRREVEVFLRVSFNQLHLLQLHCVGAAGEFEGRRWELHFDLRPKAAEPASAPAELPPETLEAAGQRILLFYGKGKELDDKLSPRNLVTELEKLLAEPKEQWSGRLLRALWVPLAKGITKRSRSAVHERVWLYLAGYLLRPGYGVELDEWRINELWRCFQAGLEFPKDNAVRTQWWVMWRRVSGGLDEARQNALYGELEQGLTVKGGEHPEAYRLAGALERLSIDRKRRLGDTLAGKIAGSKVAGKEYLFWALRRLLSRVPLYASPHLVLPPEDIERWCRDLAELDWSRPEYAALTSVMAYACRLTGDRARDVSDGLRMDVLRKMRASGARPEQLRLVEKITPLEESDRQLLFGESLPPALRLGAA